MAIFKCEYCKNRDGSNCEKCKAHVDSNGRDEVLKRLADHYGVKYNSKILNVVKASEKVLFKDLCRVFNVPSYLANKVTTNNNLAEALENHVPADELRKMIVEIIPEMNDYDQVFDNLDYVYECADMVYGASVHASGTIISETPIEMPNNEGACHANGHYCEDLGYIKFDLLGLSNLDAIEAMEGLDVDWEASNSPEVFDYIYEKSLAFVFQFGSPVVDNMIHGVKRDAINVMSLSEITSINRPGPLGIGLNKTWVDVQNGEIKYEEEVTKIVDDLRKNGALKV